MSEAILLEIEMPRGLARFPRMWMSTSRLCSTGRAVESSSLRVRARRRKGLSSWWSFGRDILLVRLRLRALGGSARMKRAARTGS